MYYSYEFFMNYTLAIHRNNDIQNRALQILYLILLVRSKFYYNAKYTIICKNIRKQILFKKKKKYTSLIVDNILYPLLCENSEECCFYEVLKDDRFFTMFMNAGLSSIEARICLALTSVRRRKNIFISPEEKKHI